MLPVSTVAPFVAASLVLLVLPGPAVLYIMARSSAQGTRAGVVSVAGVHSASVVHVVAAVAGLSAVVVASANAFTAVRWIGGGYLIVLGVRAIVSARGERARRPAVAQDRPGARLFVESFLVNLFNPKVALFVLAFLPQFVDAGRGPVWAQTMLLGLLYVGLGIVTDGVYAVLGGSAGRWTLRRISRASTTPQVVEGAVLIGLGVLTLAIPDRRR